MRPIVTWRGQDEQNEAKAKGLSNAAWGSSPHNHVDGTGMPCSLAFDFACFSDGQYLTDGTDYHYSHAGDIAKQLGMVWGGDWHHPDFDHIEVPDWQTYDLGVVA